MRGAILDSERLDRAIENARKPKRGTLDPKRLSRLSGALRELERRRSGYIDLAADKLMPKDELREKLSTLDAQISALKGEYAELAREAQREDGERARASATLQMLREFSPEMLDLLDGAQRRQFHADLDLEVMARQAGSFTLTWLVGLDLGEIWWETEGTSTR